jgi:hypothetical protein
MRKWFIAACIGAALTAPAFAQQFRSQLMTAPEMIGAAQGVKNKNTQPLLEKWVRVCLQKEWGNCQVAWWALAEKGGLVQIEGDGYSTWGFLKQPDANQVLMHMITGLNNPTYRSAWDIEITTTKQYDDVPNIVDGRNALTDGLDHKIALAIITERFLSRKVGYDVSQEMPLPRLEWLRLVSLMYAVRDDITSAYQVLGELQKHANITPDAAKVYNQTLQAIQAYIKSEAVK